jgi:hypothetical protein
MFASSSLATPKPIRKKKHKIAKASRIDDFIVFAPEKLIGLIQESNASYILGDPNSPRQKISLRHRPMI